jgi:hypothetical protein
MDFFYNRDLDPKQIRLIQSHLTSIIGDATCKHQSCVLIDFE